MSQNKDILYHLKNYETITPLEALSLYGIMRLGARIFDLKKLGFEIQTSTIQKNGKHFAEYRRVK